MSKVALKWTRRCQERDLSIRLQDEERCSHRAPSHETKQSSSRKRNEGSDSPGALRQDPCHNPPTPGRPYRWVHSTSSPDDATTRNVEQSTENSAASPAPDSPRPGSPRVPSASRSCMRSLKNNFFFVFFFFLLKNKKPAALLQIWSYSA